MSNTINNKILIIYIIKLIRKYNYLNNKPYSSEDIHYQLVKLNIRPLPSEKNIKNILMICGKVTDRIF
jgi:hypothetical protein